MRWKKKRTFLASKLSKWPKMKKSNYDDYGGSYDQYGAAEEKEPET